MRKVLTILMAAMALSLMLVAPSGAAGEQTDTQSEGSERSVDWAKVVREFDDDGTPTDGTEGIGWSRLVRTADGLKAKLFVKGLKPGGVYTFWWVVPHSTDPAIPDDVFVARGKAKVIGKTGMTFVTMRARTGQQGIEGFPPLEGAEWHPLTDPLNSVVRVEIAYHGQKKDAGTQAELDKWRSDFWTGSACPEPGGVNAAGQPFCPVYLAATHSP